MGRRVTKAESALIGLVLIIALPIAGIVALVDYFGMENLAIFVAVLVVIIILFAILSMTAKKKAALEHARRLMQEQRERVTQLTEKYGDEEIVTRIVNKTLWVGQTEEQLVDTLGHPVDTDSKVLKTKRREVWKYFPKSRRSFGLKVTVENGEVVGWDEKM